MLSFISLKMLIYSCDWSDNCGTSRSHEILTHLPHIRQQIIEVPRQVRCLQRAWHEFQADGSKWWNKRKRNTFACAHTHNARWLFANGTVGVKTEGTQQLAWLHIWERDGLLTSRLSQLELLQCHRGPGALMFLREQRMWEMLGETLQWYGQDFFFYLNGSCDFSILFIVQHSLNIYGGATMNQLWVVPADTGHLWEASHQVWPVLVPSNDTHTSFQHFLVLNSHHTRFCFFYQHLTTKLLLPPHPLFFSSPPASSWACKGIAKRLSAPRLILTVSAHTA